MRMCYSLPLLSAHKFPTFAPNNFDIHWSLSLARALLLSHAHKNGQMPYQLIIIYSFSDKSIETQHLPPRCVMCAPRHSPFVPNGWELAELRRNRLTLTNEFSHWPQLTAKLCLMRFVWLKALCVIRNQGVAAVMMIGSSSRGANHENWFIRVAGNVFGG